MGVSPFIIAYHKKVKKAIPEKFFSKCTCFFVCLNLKIFMLSVWFDVDSGDHRHQTTPERGAS